MQVTIKQLQEQLGVDYPVAANLAKLAVATGQGREVGKVDMKGQKGKPAAIYELPDELTISLKTKAPAEPAAA